MKKLIKQSFLLFLFSFGLLSSPLLAVEKKVRVSAERAPVYAEAHTDSYRIEIVRKGTILTVFDSGESTVTWYYVYYRSKRWNSQVTGFIQASMVEEVSDKPEEKIPLKKIKPKPEKPPEKVLVATSPLPYRPHTSLPTLAMEEEPRVFMYIEPSPPEKEEIVLQQEKWEEVQPRIEKPKVAPVKVKPKIEQIMVTESVGISPVLVSKSYALPESRWEEKPRVFLSIDTKPAQPPQPKKPRLPGEKSLFTLGAGYGPSGGSGLGGFVQFNTQKGFSFHVGAGLYPTTYFYSEHEWAKNQVLFSAGVKYYLPFKTDWIRTYLDLQYGGISIEAVRLVTGIWYYQYTYENIQKTLYGPSLLAGIELRFGKIGLNGAIGLSYNTTEWNYWEKDYFLTADVGVLIYLW